MDHHTELGPLHWGGFDYDDLRGVNAGLSIGRFSVGLSFDWRVDA